MDAIGRDKAVAVCQNVNIAIVAPNQASIVRTVPGPEIFHGKIANYQHQNILNLILFYNDNFGILNDNISTRQNKVHSFLLGFD